jgi:hypothetical protein
MGVLFGAGILALTRNFKKKGALDMPLYFGIPFMYWVYTKKTTYMSKLFEVAYPPHPLIIEKRRNVINKCCFFAPSMIKNEIEYMHSKIEGINSEKDLIDKIENSENKYEKEFETGNIGLIHKNKKKENGKKFKIIVEHGELYL